jgi:autotransporter-associated beta strand protein
MFASFVKSNNSKRLHWLARPRRVLCVHAMGCVGFVVNSAQAATIDWSALATSTTWASGFNWDGLAAPGATDIARFNKTSYVSQPNSGTTNINGIQIGDGITVTAALTITNTNLSIGNSGISVFANAGTATLSGGSVKIAANQNWANNSGSLLTISSNIINNGNTNPFALTLNGSGTGGTTINGVISDGGATGTTALIINTTGGTTTLSANNAYTGGTTVSAGKLQLSGSGTLGSTSGALTVNGGTLDLNGTNQTVGVLSGSGGTILNNNSSAKTLTVGQGSGTGSYGGVIADHTSGSGTLALTKTGAGTQTLTGANTYSGSTTISGGTLTAAASSGSALASTSGVTVNSGGTLLLGANDQINNAATMTLAGGTFAKGNFSEGTAGSGGTSTLGLGALTLTATGSIIDFGTGTVGVLSFASLNAATFTLTINNWTGNYNTVGSVSTDRLIFDSDQASNLNNFSFTGYGAGGVEFNLGGGYWEVVAAVPEPSTWLVGLLVFGSIGYDQARRHRKHLRKLANCALRARC